MDPITDHQLLDRFVREDSEDAFRELVQRHVPLVYSVALRHTNNPHHAQDITQVVFVILARKARSIGPKVVLSGWLYHTARLTAANWQRSEMHRASREKEAFMQQTLEAEPDHTWTELVPVLDEGMSRLRPIDRDAVILRYFENKSLRDVASALGLAERTAQKRVARSIEKLRAFFLKRGVVLTSSAIVGAVSANSIHGAPAHLGASVTAGSLSAFPPSMPVQWLTQATLRELLWPKILNAGLGAVVLLLVTGFVMFHHQTRAASAGGNLNVQMTHPVGANPRPVKTPSPATIRIELTGTAGLPFELVHSEGGNPQTETGVLPKEVSFRADAFTTQLSVRGSGKLGLQLYRNALQMLNMPPAPLTNHAIVSIEVRKGGTGMSAKNSFN
jgi:RNA polymerase sigma factor (sigma-70 family)